MSRSTLSIACLTQNLNAGLSASSMFNCILAHLAYSCPSSPIVFRWCYLIPEDLQQPTLVMSEPPSPSYVRRLTILTALRLRPAWNIMPERWCCRHTPPAHRQRIRLRTASYRVVCQVVATDERAVVPCFLPTPFPADALCPPCSSVCRRRCTSAPP
jgi:hypothetical protein